MTELFDMLTTIARRRVAPAGSPFASEKSVLKWLKNLPDTSDYDAHHALVQGLEHFNAQRANATPERLRMLLAIEARGLPLQARLIEQYLRNQSTFRLAKQALWRESWTFWSHMSEAWLVMLKYAFRGAADGALKPHIVEMGVRALRYAGLTMRWNFHQGYRPSPTAWCRVNKLYRLLERDGLAQQPVLFQGRATDCAREFSLIVLMGLLRPVGYRPQVIESYADILENCPHLPLGEAQPDKAAHTHALDLAQAEGARLIDAVLPQGPRLRYFGLRELMAYLRSIDSPGSASDGLPRQMASLIARGGTPRTQVRTRRDTTVWTAVGIDRILAALAPADAETVRPALQAWTLRDESPEGLGFALPRVERMPVGGLVVMTWEASTRAWQLLVIRWQREEGDQMLVGAQWLSRHPKRVRVYFESSLADGAGGSAWAVFLPLAQAGEGGEMSHLLLPQSHYRQGVPLLLQDDDVRYRLYPGVVRECHEGWVRVAVEVVGRERFADAA